jgi:exopolysaccharide biosynthesis protein
MKVGKKLLPIWLIFLIDISIIASYVGGFYGLYYRMPRELESSGIKTDQEGANNITNETETDITNENTVDTELDNELEESSENVASAVNTEPTNDNESAATTESNDNSQSTFTDKFTDVVISTANSYTSSNISITVNKYTEGSGKNIVTYYIADIYLKDITYLQSGFADNTYGVGYTDNVLNMDEVFNAILAINGDYYGNGGNGVVVRNGEVYRSSTSGSDVCVLYYDGTMKTFAAEEFDMEQAIAGGAYQAWSFGPELLDDSGNSKTTFTADGHVKRSNPRSAIGYYEPGHYCFVVVDGRQSGYSVGMTLTDLSELFEELGCVSAYNLDGGKSSEMTFNDAFVNQPADGGREVSDCIIIKEVN